MKILPDQATLNALLRYEPDTGELFWRERPAVMFAETTYYGGRARNSAIWKTKYAGREALTDVNDSGYRRGNLLRSPVRAHRVIWKMVYGIDAEEIDHIDGDRTNNRIDNLRAVSRTENGRNICTSATNKSGHIGVHFDRSRSKWTAYIKVDQKRYNLGRFAGIDAAIAARKAAETRFNFHGNHGRPAHIPAPTTKQ